MSAPSVVKLSKPSLPARLARGAAAGLFASAGLAAAFELARAVGLVREPPAHRVWRQGLSRLGVPHSPRRRWTAGSLLGHAAYGAGLGALFSLWPSRKAPMGHGALFGLGVWAGSYAGWVPAAGLLPRPRLDRPGRQATLIVGHALYGAVLGAVSDALQPKVFPARVAVVCGGSRGLGRALALEFARRGVSVAVCARSQSAVERTTRELEALGTRAYGEACDLRHTEQVEGFLARVTERLGAIDLLVANAATLNVAPIETREAKDFDEAWESIFKTALNPVLGVLPAMRARQGGTLVFITSIGGKIGVPHLAPYSAAKFAQVGFAQALRGEVQRDGVHVLTVVPGLMRTGSPAHVTFKGDPEKEFAWFTAGALAPVLSIDADRAARRIADAIERKEDELVYTLPARLAARLHDLVPGVFNALVSLAGALLPKAPAIALELEGKDVSRTSTAKPVVALKRPLDALSHRHAHS